MPSLMLQSVSGHNSSDREGGQILPRRSVSNWLLGSSVLLALLLTLIQPASQRSATLASLVAMVAISASLIPWLWVTWFERHLRWQRWSSLITLALALVAAAQIARAIYSIDSSVRDTVPIGIDLLRLIGLSAAVLATSWALLVSGRRSLVGIVLVPVLVAVTFTILMFGTALLVSDRDATRSPAIWLLALTLVAMPIILSIALLISGISNSGDHRLPTASLPLSLAWVSISVVMTGAALDRLLLSDSSGSRTSWAALPAFAFLTAGAIDFLAHRTSPVAIGIDVHAPRPVPSETWIRALIPSLVAAGSATAATILFVDQDGLASKLIAVLIVAIAAAIVIQQSVSYVRLAREAAELEVSRRELALAATVDPVSGLPNRRALDTRLREEAERAIRYKQPLSLCFVDVDHFKAVNDALGHATGDLVLREIGGILRRTVRGIDFVGRYGGEEFVIILPGTWSGDAMTLGDRLCRAVAHHAFVADGRRPLRLSVSIGIAGLPEHARSGEALQHAADTAVYRAKAAGRNRVVLFEPAAVASAIEY